MIVWSTERVLVVEKERLFGLLFLFVDRDGCWLADRGMAVGSSVGELIGAGFLFLRFGAFGSYLLTVLDDFGHTPFRGLNIPFASIY